MPIYSFYCDNCETDHDEYFKIDDCPRQIKCHDCDGKAKKIIAQGHGGVLSDSPKWINGQTREVLQNMDRVRAGLEAPIETRGQLNRHIKERGLIPLG